MIKKIKQLFNYLISTTLNGLYFLFYIVSNGFFFYFYFTFSILEKIFKFKFIKNSKNYFSNKQKDPSAFLTLLVIFLLSAFLYTYLYTDKTEVKYIDKNILDVKKTNGVKPEKRIESDKDTYTDNEINLYRKYGKMNINDVNITELKKDNSNIIAWIMVDGTNVNYPVVQTNNNDYYLNHDITDSPKGSGWVFEDFRNNIEMTDQNTIFYGHNLLNKTAFGSLSNVFTDKWFKNSNHYILVKTETKRFLYQVFSNYYIDPEIYYLQNNFYQNNDYQDFLNTLKGRSLNNYNIDLTTNDRIITLSTCTDDNKGRKVIHAKLIEESNL